MWFMGIYQVVAGQGDAEWARLAARGWLALVVAAGIGVGATLLAYRRVLGRTLEAVQAGGGRSLVVRLADLVGRVVARHPAERGFYAFTVTTVLRSPWHRVVLAVCVGVALALSVVTLDIATLGRDSLHRVPMRESHALAMQCVILVIVLAGIRVAASAPSELRASWVLRMLETDRPERWMAGFRKAVFVSLVAPVLAAMAAATYAQYGWHTAWTLGLAALGFAVIAFEVLFLGFGRVPFACPIQSETGEVRVRGPVMVALFTILIVPVAELVTLALRSATGTALVIGVGAAAVVVLRWRAQRALTQGGGLAFEPEDRRTQALGL